MSFYVSLRMYNLYCETLKSVGIGAYNFKNCGKIKYCQKWLLFIENDRLRTITLSVTQASLFENLLVRAQRDSLFVNFFVSWWIKCQLQLSTTDLAVHRATSCSSSLATLPTYYKQAQ